MCWLHMAWAALDAGKSLAKHVAVDLAEADSGESEPAAFGDVPRNFGCCGGVVQALGTDIRNTIALGIGATGAWCPIDVCAKRGR